MARPTHMYMTINPATNGITVHYGSANRIKQAVLDEKLGGDYAYSSFVHPEKGNVFAFRKIGEPQQYELDGMTLEARQRRIITEVSKKGIRFLKPQEVYPYDDLSFVKVDMCNAVTVAPPGVPYTTGLACCIGISLYNPQTHDTHLYHTPGCDPDMLPAIAEHLDGVLQELTKGRLADGKGRIQANVASGLVTLGDDEIADIIKSARREIVKHLKSRDIEPITHFAEIRGESVTFMSIISHDGLVEVVKRQVAY